MYLLVRIVLVAGDKNAAQMDLSKKKKKKKLLKSPGLGEASGRARSRGLNISSRIGLYSI